MEPTFPSIAWMHPKWLRRNAPAFWAEVERRAAQDNAARIRESRARIAARLAAQAAA